MSVREKDWMQTVIDAATTLNWMVYHTHDSRRSTPGFPDLILIRDTEMLVIELKTDCGRTSPAQEQWLDAFSGVAGLTVMVCRPTDWPEVEQALTMTGHHATPAVAQSLPPESDGGVGSGS